MPPVIPTTRIKVLDTDGSVCAMVENGCLILRNRKDKDRYTAYNLLQVWSWLRESEDVGNLEGNMVE